MPCQLADKHDLRQGDCLYESIFSNQGTGGANMDSSVNSGRSGWPFPMKHRLSLLTSVNELCWRLPCTNDSWPKSGD